MKRRTITKELELEFIELYLAGSSLSAIERKLGIGRHTLSWYLEKNGIAIRSPQFYRKGYKFSDEHRRNLCADWHKKHPNPCTPRNKLPFEQAIFNNLRSRAKRKNYEFSISMDNVKLLTRSPCAYCGQMPNQKYRYREEQPIQGIDRIDSSIGYTDENCAPCCEKCNRMKSNFSLDDFLSHIEAIANFQSTSRLIKNETD